MFKMDIGVYIIGPYGSPYISSMSRNIKGPTGTRPRKHENGTKHDFRHALTWGLGTRIRDPSLLGPNFDRNSCEQALVPNAKVTGLIQGFIDRGSFALSIVPQRGRKGQG